MKSFPLMMVLLAGLTAASCKKEASVNKPPGIPTAPTSPTGAPTSAPVAPAHAATPNPAEAEMVPSAPDPGSTVEGTIFIPANRKKDLNKNAILFITARRAGGAPGPGAMMGAQKHPIGDFPMPFSLSSRDAMIPGTPFDGEVNISVRIDSDGDAITRKKGDLFGVANGIKVGTHNVNINIDQIQAEDETLGGRPPGAGRAMPPGHP